MKEGKPARAELIPDKTNVPANRKAARGGQKALPKPTGRELTVYQARNQGLEVAKKGSSLYKKAAAKGLGRLIPGVGLALTAIQVANLLGMADETEASKRANRGGQSGRNRTSPAQEASARASKKKDKTPPAVTEGGDVKPHRAKSAMESGQRMVNESRPRSSKGKSFPTGAPDRKRTSGHRDSDDLGYKMAKAMGDTRTKEQMVADRKANKRAEKEMGR